MARKMPAQKPHTSEQTVCTPPEFLSAVLDRLGQRAFSIDLAASDENAVCDPYFTRETNALVQPWHVFCAKEFGWCNPEFSMAEEFTFKARHAREFGAKSALLVPASPGSNWWCDNVSGHAYITYLRGRIQFVGHTHPYPKDLALLLYAPFLQGGSCSWRWKPLRYKVA